MPKHAIELTKAQALTYKEAVLSLAKIAVKTGMSRSALSHLFALAEKLPQTLPQTVQPRKVGSGHPPIITETMKKEIKKDPTLSAKQLKVKVSGMSRKKVRTIQDVLCRVMGLHSECVGNRQKNWT